MALKNLEEIDKMKNQFSEKYNITPNLNQSVVIFICFFSMACGVLILEWFM
ncbi:MAG: hypothetical protein JKY84_02740 [Emcibacteraceae bacterium]|nr:hypothetical protein [Emcibacteraceae bacterium]